MPDTQKLLTRLSGGDLEDIREAAFEAGTTRCLAAVGELARLLTSSNLGVQEAADSSLRLIGGAAVVDAVIPLLRSDDPPARNLSMDILRAVGVQDFQALVKLLRDDDVDIRIFASDIIGSTKSVMAVEPLCDALLHDPEVNVRYQAAVSLGELAFKEASPCLGKAMNDEEWVQFAVIEALAKIKDDTSVGALVKALNKATDLVASMIVDALGEMGNIKAVSSLIKRLDTSPTPLRHKIVKAVVLILGGKSLSMLSSAEQEKFGEYLLSAMTDEDPEIQDVAMDGLAGIGGDKAQACVLQVAARIDAENDADRLDHAVSALTSMGFTPALEDGLRADDYKTNLLVIEVMARLALPETTALLQEVFRDKERDVQRAMAEALARSAGPEAKDFFVGLLTAHDDGTILKIALEYLGQKVHAEEAADTIFNLLDHPYDDVKEAALDACIALGGPHMEERFREMFASSDPIRRLMAVYAMGRRDVERHLDILRLALEDEEADIRKIALEAVATLCSSSMESLELLVSKLNDENRDVRLTVVEQIGRCSLAEGTKYLLEALQDADDWVRVRAMESLASRAEAEVVPHIIPLLESPNKLLAIKAAETLGEIGGKIAFRALLELAASDDFELQGAAEAALDKIRREQGAEGS